MTRVSRAERHAEISALRAEGLLLREIAQRLGLSTSMVHNVLADPTGQKTRERKRRFERPCVDCGKTINPNGVRPMTQRCQVCHGAHVREQTRRWILDSFREWNEQFGVPPTATDWNPAYARSHGMSHKVERYENTGRPWPGPSVVIKIFGTWNAGRAAAGFETFATGHYGREGEDPEIVSRTVELYQSGLSLVRVGELMGVTEMAVWNRLKTAGVPRRSPAEAQALRRHTEKAA